MKGADAMCSGNDFCVNIIPGKEMSFTFHDIKLASKVDIKSAREYLDCDFQFSLKSQMKEMKAQTQQPLTLGKMTKASFQPSSLSLNSLCMSEA